MKLLPPPLITTSGAGARRRGRVNLIDWNLRRLAMFCIVAQLPQANCARPSPNGRRIGDAAHLKSADYMLRAVERNTSPPPPGAVQSHKYDDLLSATSRQKEARDFSFAPNHVTTAGTASKRVCVASTG